jgi:hypothetical protein
MSSAHERFAGVEGIESLSTNTCNRGHKSPVASGQKFEIKNLGEISLFRAEFSLIRVQKFPVPLRREFSWKPLNSPADWAPKLQCRA